MSRKSNPKSVIHERIKTEEWGNETLDIAVEEIERMASKLGLEESVVTVAKAIYRRSLKNEFIQNRTIAQVASSSIYAACRVENKGFSSKDVWEVSHATHKAINRTFADVSRELGLKTGPVDPSDFVPRYCHELGLSEKVEQTAIDLIDKTTEVGVEAGYSPSGTAAAAIYSSALLRNEKVTQPEIARITKVSESTVRNRYQAQIEYLGEVYSDGDFEEGIEGFLNDSESE